MFFFLLKIFLLNKIGAIYQGAILGHVFEPQPNEGSLNDSQRVVSWLSGTWVMCKKGGNLSQTTGFPRS